MSIGYLIILLSMVFWIFPAIRQYKTNLFFYFWILAISDPLVLFLYYFISVKIYYTQLVLVFFTMLYLYWSSLKKNYVRIVIFLILAFMLVSLFLSPSFIKQVIILINIIILFIFVHRTIVFIAKNGKVNIFHVVLLVYQTSIIMKQIAALTNANTGIVNFYTTSAFQFLVAIFFSIFREENNKLLVDLRNV